MATLTNKISIQNKVNQELKKSRYQAFAYNAALTRFSSAKRDLMEDFDNDPVNQEIQAGPTAQNSDYLAWGNLYSFIGFNIDSTPIQELREFIDKNVDINEKAKFSAVNNRFTYNFPVKYPTMEEIYQETSMDKFAGDYPNGKSFVELMRGAINNTLGNYIFHIFFKVGSRSTTGLQNKNADNTFNSFKDAPDYIIGLFKKFKAKFIGK